MIRIKTFLLLGALMLVSISSFAHRMSFDEGWKFIQQDVPGAEKILFNDASWRVLDVPHDWSIEGS